MEGDATSDENRCTHTFMSKGRAPPPVRWIHQVKVDGTLTYRAGKRGTDLIAQWPGLGTLTCGRAGEAASFAAVAGASERTIAKLQRAQVRGLLRDLTGGLTVHASAVSVEGRAVLFIGPNGAGKSTAAAEMCLWHGAMMFADDAASLEVGPAGAYVAPYEEDHWLTPESCSSLGIAPGKSATSAQKQDLRATNVAIEPHPLALIVALRFDPSIKSTALRWLHGGDAARLLLEAVIRFDLEDGGARQRELNQLMTIHQGALFLEIVRPLRDPGGVAAFVLDALRRSRQ